MPDDRLDPSSPPAPETASASEDAAEPVGELKVEPCEADHRPRTTEAKDLVDSGGAPAVSGAVGGGGGQSFSQLLAGAMAGPPAATEGGRPPPILTVPVVAVPCFLTPAAALIESPGFKGQFVMTHQAVLATVTAQAQMQMQMQHTHSPSSESMTNKFSQPLLSPMSPVPLQQLPSPLPEGSASDVYHWRKYGQKQVKSSDNSRSYYRCTDANCSAKKKVERRPDGIVVDVTYRGTHTHDPPAKYRYTRDKGHQSTGASGENENIEQPPCAPKGTDISSCKDEHNTGSETLEQQLFCSSDCEVDAGMKNEEDVAGEPDMKRRLIESPKWSSTPSQKAVREYIVQTEIDARHLSDGYRWRKYGQKFVKGNPNPRSYYRCTHEGCPVRKHVEKASHDAKSLLITYEGKHNHDQPASKYLSEPSATTPTTPKGAISVASKKSDESSSSVNKKSLEISQLDSAAETMADEKTKELRCNNGGSRTLESAHALLSIGSKSSTDDDANKMNSDNVKHPLFNESKAVVPVENS